MALAAPAQRDITSVCEVCRTALVKEYKNESGNNRTFQTARLVHRPVPLQF